MRAAFAITVLLMISAAAITPVAGADVIRFGNSRFDFDAPGPALSGAQDTFFRQYKHAINSHDETALMSLQDDSIKRCKAISRELIAQGLKDTIPDNAKVRFFAATGDVAKDMGFGDMAYLSARPTAMLGISGRTASQREIKIVTILRPVRQEGDRISLVPYCLTEKGQQFLEQKNKR